MEINSLSTTDEWEARIGLDLRRLRQQQRLTQTELCERANVSLSALKSLERGRGSSLSTTIRVARALGQYEWLGALSGSVPAISPMDLLRQRQIATSRSPLSRRVRRGSAQTPSS